MFVCPLFSQHGCSPGFVVDNGNENVELTRMTSTIFKIYNDLLFFLKSECTQEAGASTLVPEYMATRPRAWSSAPCPTSCVSLESRLCSL